ncbi:hypothetical protein RND81_13G024100 [Saponaria officinalis]|uniref:Agenet domain-containing protein n=1 Tax=Saponaria officinalis TaxID=3572 RepID=A0AAW1GZN6_SAPOF
MVFSYVAGSKVEVSFPGVGFMLGYYVGCVLWELEEGVYYVEFDHLFENYALIRDVVSVEQIRPCPPNVGRNNFSIGDTVEVFVNDGWWVGKVEASYRHENCFEVVLDGSGEDVVVHACDMRLHQVWEDGTWIIVLD